MLLASMRCSARLLGLAATAVALGLAGLAAPRAVHASELEAPREAPSETILHLQGMTYVSSKGEVNEVVLDAERAHILPDRDVAHLEQVRANLSAADGEGALSLVCERGTFEMSSGDFLAEGNVQGITGDGRRFFTDSLRYSHEQALVTTNLPVVIREETGTYRGGGFRYHVRENRFRLLGGATVVQEP
jgi:LPS export ABC transporter protein LptC